MDDEKLLLAEYEFFADSFWRNEEVGERRVEFFITLTTAVIAGIVALLTGDRTNLSGVDIRLIATAALTSIFLFGLVTFLRILQRNRVTDEYKAIVRYIREVLRRRSSSLSEYDLPFQSSRRLLQGGLAETVALMNSIIAATLSVMLFGQEWGWIMVVSTFLILFVTQIGVARKVRATKESRSQTFRAGVGAMISNDDVKVLALERKDIPGSWQLPQGGLEIGESPLEAVKREILEETGIRENELQLLSTESRLLAYELPPEARSKKTGRGQVQQWFLFRFIGLDKAIDLGDKKEFKAWKWISIDELLSSVVSFKRPVYEELAEYFSRYLEESK